MENPILQPLIDLWNQKVKMKYICEQCNLSMNNLKNIIRLNQNLFARRHSEPNKRELQERNQQIATAFKSGIQTYQQIADKYGITRERVRQILIRSAGGKSLFERKDVANRIKSRTLTKSIAKTKRRLKKLSKDATLIKTAQEK
jgi:hypothetical protein